MNRTRRAGCGVVRLAFHLSLVSLLACSGSSGGTEVDNSAQADATEDQAEELRDVSDEDEFSCTPPMQDGCPCESAKDCSSGLCVATPVGDMCAHPCANSADCPSNLECLGLLQPVEKEVARVCLLPENVTCRPCVQSDDCGQFLCHSNDQESGCASLCVDGKCPSGEVCTEVGGGVQACLPETGSCSCRDSDSGRFRTCAVSSDAGVCLGLQTCELPGGWTTCDAPVPEEEKCNGVDDNCDGLIDDSNDCDDQNSCTTDTCLDGKCVNSLVYDEPCDDGTLCTGNDACEAGVCVGEAVNCNDGSECTTDSCDPDIGCVWTPVDGQCDDGDICTLGDTCVFGKCLGTELNPACAGACGDAKCSSAESAASCPVDCGYCGDSVCGHAEWSGAVVLCPQDCLAACGDGVCEGGESTEVCLPDCSGCGDGFCGLAETAAVCPIDCPPSCGNGQCELFEGVIVCPYDCGPTCGNGVCEWGENPWTCGEDCAVCGDSICSPVWEDMNLCSMDCAAACGNGLCQGGETADECPVDCGSCGDGVCGFAETASFCPADCMTFCGDGQCQAWYLETFSSCGADCLQDPDNDGIVWAEDNCPITYNSDQSDIDTDGVGDLCDRDMDGDGEGNSTDCAPQNPSISHSAVDLCDGVDNNCDGQVDPGLECDDGIDCTVDYCGSNGECSSQPVNSMCAVDNPCELGTCSPNIGCEAHSVPDGLPCYGADETVPDPWHCSGGVCVCSPECQGRECGPDGCGGTCGSCPETGPFGGELTCLWDGTCQCLPSCGGKSCGADGCGGSCGSCPPDAECHPTGQCGCVSGTTSCGPFCCAPNRVCYKETCCTPKCDGLTCGSDGCGGTCGVCPQGFECLDPGYCFCLPKCGGRQCGDDGCGGQCGQCTQGWTCLGGTCQCLPDCVGRECGEDGCGGTCGSCSAGTACVGGACLPVGTGTCTGGWCSAAWGTFQMGTPETEFCRTNDNVQHLVSINHTFLVKQTEVTNKEWQEVMGGALAGTELNPVAFVSWYDAAMWCNLRSEQDNLQACYVFTNCTGVAGQGCPTGQEQCDGGFECETVTLADNNCTGYRLPSEAEWEYVARSGSASATHLGDPTWDCTCSEDSLVSPVAWYCANSGNSVHQVGTRVQNAWGLLDVLGNVSEWTWDNYTRFLNTSVAEPVGSTWASDGVVRGGSYNESKDAVRLGSRKMAPKRNRLGHVGFRPVRTVIPCYPNCTYGFCGPDGCGGQCTCGSDQQCVAGVCESLSVGTCAGNWCLVPNGSFEMGSLSTDTCRVADEEPRHFVRISRSLLVSQHEVTQGEWITFIYTNPSYLSSCGPSCPVESVSFLDAVYYANTLSVSEGYEQCYSFSSDCSGQAGACSGGTACGYGLSCSSVESRGPSCTGYRLPSEAEWEYLARGNTGVGAFFSGGISNCTGADPTADTIAWYADNSTSLLAPVSLRAPNPFGLYDVAGNVWEWVEDDGVPYSPGLVQDPVNIIFPRCPGFRGGSYLSEPGDLRHARRGRNTTCQPDSIEYSAKDLGFRLVRTVESVCFPDCTQRECGDDGCSGTCGSCGSGMVCTAGKCELESEVEAQIHDSNAIMPGRSRKRRTSLRVLVLLLSSLFLRSSGIRGRPERPGRLPWCRSVWFVVVLFTTATWIGACGGGGEGNNVAAGDSGGDVGLADTAADNSQLADGSSEVASGCNSDPRPFGCECAAPEDCASGLCASVGGRRQCTEKCSGQCLPGFTCLGTTLVGNTVEFVCMPSSGVCLPCGPEGECEVGACLASAQNTGWCHLLCDQTHPCPEFYDCVPAPGHPEGWSFCVPKSQTCLCTSQHSGAPGVCSKANTFGQCWGNGICDPAVGFINCDAAEPEAEQCDGVDNDCDGQADEPPACDDSNPCTIDDCTSELECSHMPVATGPCEDGNPCTLGDSCVDAVCVPGPLVESCESTCGDGVCVMSESPDDCPNDCGYCGDGYCSSPENLVLGPVCPVDCLTACGDKLCEGGEDSSTCQVDCGTCGDGLCGLNEDHADCEEDCPSTCGDDNCEAEEEGQCPADCVPPCGDGLCTQNENYESCPADCHICGDGLCGASELGQCDVDCLPFCGNGLCQGGEDMYSCSLDCGPCGDGVCGMLETYESCPSDCMAGCGDGECVRPPESVEACPPDCADDADSDGVPASQDNCPAIHNPLQQDHDGDTAGDACDLDDDGDGYWDSHDCSPLDSAVYPGAQEVCNGLDDDCDSSVDGDSLCSDGVECTIDLCKGGLGCDNIIDLSICDDGNFCTEETCSSSDVGCVSQPKPDNTACGSSDHWVCKAGLCKCSGSCLNRQCGDNGCGQPCGTCPLGQVCLETGQCMCLPSCYNRECGPDGCGGSCGQCPPYLECAPDGYCMCPANSMPCGISCCPSGYLCQGDYCCQPDCTGRQCGDDGCGGNCGTCTFGSVCREDGTCMCLPDCSGRSCGPDGCGGECGKCPNSGDVCQNGQCICVPDCTGRTCGSDGCGGGCGSCTLGAACIEGNCVVSTVGSCTSGWCSVAPGVFQMSSPADEPCRDLGELAHEVTLIRNMVVKQHEVTISEFAKVMGSSPVTDGCTDNECPVRFVSWFDAVFYANELSLRDMKPPCYKLEGCSGVPGGGCQTSSGCEGSFSCSKVTVEPSCNGYRLPTEAEWEYFARAGSTGMLTDGSSPNLAPATCTGCLYEEAMADEAYYCYNSMGLPHTTGSLAPNNWGLYDVLGNVGEWVWDAGGAMAAAALVDPWGPGDGMTRTVRGGSFTSTPGMVRLSSRKFVSASYRAPDTGFRLAVFQPPPCTPMCGTKVCGSDSCGGYCGFCGSGEVCVEGQCAAVLPGMPVGNMVVVQASTFSQGSDGTEICRDFSEVMHETTITRPFLIQYHETTQQQWIEVFGKNPSINSFCGSFCPVENITLFDMAEYCNKISFRDGLPSCYVVQGCTGEPGAGLMCSGVDFSGLDCIGYRLPVEAEWEMAARAGTSTAFSTGSPGAMGIGFPCDSCGDEPVLNGVARYCFNSADLPSPVASLAPNPFGLWDMAGNVQELVFDRMAGYPSSPTQDPTGSTFGSDRVARGGHFASLPADLRSARRVAFPQNSRDSYTGFRPVRTIPAGTCCP